jgi:hypothetical protein
MLAEPLDTSPAEVSSSGRAKPTIDNLAASSSLVNPALAVLIRAACSGERYVNPKSEARLTGVCTAPEAGGVAGTAALAEAPVLAGD